MDGQQTQDFQGCEVGLCDRENTRARLFLSHVLEYSKGSWLASFLQGSLCPTAQQVRSDLSVLLLRGREVIKEQRFWSPLTSLNSSL